ncbi:MAG TPA: molybdopterin-dependent oxidoreductase [Pirellulaceae bacterium]|nr:molybdopterin-dependent oxidoreductase [Pirellulaceae bacterium]
METLLIIAGEVDQPRSLTFADLVAIPAEHQVADVSRLVAGRQGDAVRLAGILALVGPKAAAKYLGLHSSTDDFHASIPLDAVAERALVIYRLNGQPLPVTRGGPVRFFIPDFAACHTDEIDECANVKFVDRIELTATRGFDNRPHDGAEHEGLHAKAATSGRGSSANS